MASRPYQVTAVTPDGQKVTLGEGYSSPLLYAAALEVWRERLERAKGHSFTLARKKCSKM